MHQIRRKASGDTVCSCRCGFDVPVILRSSEETESILPPPEKQMVQVTNPFGLELTSGPASVTGKNIGTWKPPRCIMAPAVLPALTSEPGMNIPAQYLRSTVTGSWFLPWFLPSIPVLLEGSSSCLCSLLGVWLCVSVFLCSVQSESVTSRLSSSWCLTESCLSESECSQLFLGL